MFSRRLLLVCSVTVALCAFAGTSRADVLLISGGGVTNHPSSFTGSIEVKNQTTTSAVIEVKLTNTSTGSILPGAVNGYITGFAFNDPNKSSKGNINVGALDSSDFSASYSPNTRQKFQLITNSSNKGLGGQFGNFDIAASVGNTLHTSGTASDGLSVGETGTFTFLVTGSELKNLSAANLLAELSSGATEPTAFAVRFRGYSYSKYGGDGDKVPLGSFSSPPTNAVPAPPGVLLASVGLGCLLLGRTFRRKSIAT
ncbi:MAG: hypothetical protein L0241_19540 [Planctomycetia bacterium]|nr:hypothetical protein [Planctomycetia bacterium]